MIADSQEENTSGCLYSVFSLPLPHPQLERKMNEWMDEWEGEKRERFLFILDE